MFTILHGNIGERFGASGLHPIFRRALIRSLRSRRSATVRRLSFVIPRCPCNGKDDEERFPAVLPSPSCYQDEVSVGSVCTCGGGGELWAAPQSANAAVVAAPIASNAITAAISLSIARSFLPGLFFPPALSPRPGSLLSEASSERTSSHLWNRNVKNHLFVMTLGEPFTHQQTMRNGGGANAIISTTNDSGQTVGQESSQCPRRPLGHPKPRQGSSRGIG
jgi:hypothetical protein